MLTVRDQAHSRQPGVSWTSEDGLYPALWRPQQEPTVCADSGGFTRSNVSELSLRYLLEIGTLCPKK